MFKKLKTSKPFQEGSKKAQEKKVPPEQSVKFNWYKAIVTQKDWNEYYSKERYTLLSKEGDKHVAIGFLAVEPPEGCLVITNVEELRIIDLHHKAMNLYPRPFVDKNEPRNTVQPRQDMGRNPEGHQTRLGQFEG